MGIKFGRVSMTAYRMLHEFVLSCRQVALRLRAATVDTVNTSASISVFIRTFITTFAARLAIVSLLCVSTLPASAQTPAASTAGAVSVASEERVMAAYLYKFLPYVDWPQSAFSRSDMPYVIGIAHEDEVADELIKAAAGRTINNRTVTVRKIRSAENLGAVHVLFIGKAERSRLPQWLRQAREAPILVITDADDALAKGSMINFRIVDERVRFEVALEPVEKAGLKLSSRILGVALAVVKGPGQ